MFQMDEKEIKQRATDEQKRIAAVLADAGLSEKRMKLLEPVILNTAWMKAKLDDARDAIKNSQIVISYDNGGGQKGIRENPLFKGYESLWRSYMAGMSRILDCLPPEVAKREEDAAEDHKTVLDIVLERRKREA